MESSALKDDNMSIPTDLTETDTLVEFHLFPELPLELRLKIWAATITPRIIEVKFPYQDERPRRCWHALDFPKYTSKTPPLLHINSESRAEGLRHYEISSPNDHAINRFYFYPNMDIIDIPGAVRCQWEGFFHQNGCGLVNNIQKLAVTMFLFAGDSEMVIRDLAIYCPLLKEVIIVALEATCLQIECARFCSRSSCQIKSLREFEELTDVAKLEKNDGWRKYGPSHIRKRSAREAFESIWKPSTTLPCPSARSAAICGWAKRWDHVPADEVDRFLDARALEELSQLMRWLFPEI